MRRLNSHKIKGFTLVEVIIALAIFAVLSIIGYKGISSLIQTKERVQIEDAKWQELMVFFDRFELDIKQSINRPIRNRDDDIEPAWLGRPVYAGEYGAQLAISRFGDPEQTGFLMDSRRIAYRLHDGAVELLMWPSLDLAPSAKPEIFKVLTNVSQISFNYLSTDGQWLNVWPEPVNYTASAYAQKPPFTPAAVQLNITFATGEVVTRIFAL